MKEVIIMPRVSIIVPVYNAQNAIGRCIESIIEQEYKDFELLLMDDGSKDASPEILDTYAAKNERIRVIHKPNSGVSDTRNHAMQLARGEYLQFLDADDWISANSTKELVRAMEENDVDLVVADFYRVVGENLARKGSIEADHVLTQKEFAQYLMDSPADYYYGVVWNKLYKKEIIDTYNIKMDESLSFCEDFIFNLEYYLHCKHVYPLQVPVYYYVKTEGSIVSQISISDIYKMKMNVFQYYEDFFKNIFDEDEYQEEKIDIAKFYIAAAHDNFAFPLLPGTKKVGNENVPIHFESSNQSNLTILSYYLQKGYERYLNTIADKYKLDLKEIRVLDALYRSNDACSVKSIADYTNMMEANVMLTVQTLRMKSLVSISIKSLEVSLSENAKSICQDLDQAQLDLINLCTQDFEEEDKLILNKLVFDMTQNLKQFLK